MIVNVWTHMRSMISAFLNGSRKYKRRRARDGRSVFLRAECLEQRQLLAANSISFYPAASIVAIEGTAGTDNAMVWSDATHVHIGLTTGLGTTMSSFEKSSVTLIKFLGGDGNDHFENTTNITTVAWGGAGNDTLVGGLGNDRLYGEAGHDSLYAGIGDDELYGGDGDDQLNGEAGNDRLWGENGNDNLIGGAGNDRLYGGADTDTLRGGDGDDQLYGDDGNDLLLGENGFDSLEGGAGDDRLEGGADDDSLLGGDGHDQLYGDDGHDRLWGQNGNDNLVGGAGNDQLYGGGDDDTLTGGDGNDDLYGDDGNDLLLGENGVDRLEGGAGDDRLEGGIDDDTLTGGDGNDQLYGQQGDDRLWGQNGHDTLSGGTGNDQLYGGAGIDTIIGGDGNDSLYGGEHNDRMRGDNGSDVLEGGTGNDLLYGGADDDTLIGGEGSDRLYGDDGHDRVWGQSGNDTLVGGAGNDLLDGGAHDDSLFGGDGDDQLTANDGNDLLFGEGGNDTLQGSSGNEVLVGGSGDDVITGSYGDDILIGGAGTDILYGQWDDDLLIGGTTSYDDDAATLRDLALAWSASIPYSTRIQLIEDEAFSAHLISEHTVFDDAIADSVFGGDGQDWFFQTGFQGVYLPPDVHDQLEGGAQPMGGHGSHQHSGPVILDHPPDLEGFDLVSAIDIFNDRQSDEAIHSKLPHADTGVLQREHLSLFQLVRYDQVTHYAVQGGAWSDPATWHNGVVPGAGARVLIPIGVEVQVDSVITTRLSTIRVDGMLSFDTTRNTELRVDAIVVFDTGSFEMGTAATPIMPGVTARLVIIDNGPINRTADPFAIGRGLISHGAVSIYGTEVSSYARLAGSALVGAQILALKEAPVGWKPGDTLVIAGTTGGTSQNEVRRILSISSSVLLLDEPLSYSHAVPAIDIDVHIANVTRNAVIESESTALDRRGHVMFMHNPNVHVGYAGFYRLGRTDKLQPINDPVVNGDWSLQTGTGTNPRARYSVHFHRAGLSKSTSPATVVGSAVVDSPGWGFVNHSSHVDMVNNVAFDVHGAAFTTEVGDEIGSFRGNLAIGTSGSGEAVESRIYIQDFGHRGDGFWFQGVGVTVADNVAAGNQGSAFTYYARGLIEGGVTKAFISANLPDPSIAGGAPTIEVGNMPVTRFANNVGYASGEGVAAWYVFENRPDGKWTALQDSVFWNNTVGVHIPYTHQTVIHNLKVIYITQEQEPAPPLGVRVNGLTSDIVFNQLTVQGYTTGIDVPRQGSVYIHGGSFANARDIEIRSSLGRNVSITGLQDVPRIVMILDMRGLIAPISHIFSEDIVTLDFGPFQNQRLYYTQQAADWVVFPEPRADVLPEYIGLTNQQLWDQYGIALGGAIAPANAYTWQNITGLIAPNL